MATIKSLFHKFFITLNNLYTVFLDALFPIKCIGCGIFDEWLCDSCHAMLPVVTEQVCPICKKVYNLNGETCFECYKKHPALDGVFVASFFHDELLKKIIHYYKYRFVRDLSDPLGLLMAQSLQHSSLETPDLIIPIPLHARRYRWRGFNQSEDLANALDLRIPVATDILKRKRYTKPQAKAIHKKQRIHNMRDAFTVLHSEKISNKNILLIDDVMTTGATLSECAAVLKKNGGRKVHCIVLARE